MQTRWFDKGAGRTLLCLHPLGQSAEFHAGLADALGAGWRVVSYDQRGHGAAAGQPVRDWAQLVEDAEAAVAQLDGPVHLAGFSMGGAVAADLAARLPGRFASLTLAATPSEGSALFASRACAVAHGGIAGIEAETVQRWFGASTDEAAIARARAALHRLTPEGFDAAWRAFATFAGYGAVTRPWPATLVLSFGDDLSTPPAVLDHIAATLEGAGVAVQRANVDGAGHMGLLEQPQAVATEITAFIEGMT
nr:alpha/beta fold hydrolase [Oceaniglobus trochenteri]